MLVLPASPQWYVFAFTLRWFQMTNRDSKRLCLPRSLPAKRLAIAAREWWAAKLATRNEALRQTDRGPDIIVQAGPRSVAYRLVFSLLMLNGILNRPMIHSFLPIISSTSSVGCPSRGMPTALVFPFASSLLVLSDYRPHSFISFIRPRTASPPLRHPQTASPPLRHPQTAAVDVQATRETRQDTRETVGLPRVSTRFCRPSRANMAVDTRQMVEINDERRKPKHSFQKERT
jgi:hypothetical protein